VFFLHYFDQPKVFKPADNGIAFVTRNVLDHERSPKVARKFQNVVACNKELF